MTSPGSTKMIEDRVPAAEATVCTMLFSCRVAPLKARSTAMEITAAGMEVAKVSPALSPKYTFAAVKSTVISTPRISPRRVSSARDSIVMSLFSASLFEQAARCRSLRHPQGRRHKIPHAAASAARTSRRRAQRLLEGGGEGLEEEGLRGHEMRRDAVLFQGLGHHRADGRDQRVRECGEHFGLRGEREQGLHLRRAGEGDGIDRA